MEHTPTPHATPDDIRTAFDGIGYPVSRDQVLRHARDQGGIDHEVVDILARIPERSYEDEAELLSAVRAVYLLEGVPPDAIPI